MARRGSAEGPSGLVVIDKEAGWTSHDVVAKLRRLLSQKRTGHAGTLDPSATGVLLVGVGRATRLLRYLQETTKGYDGELVLGATTTTLDAEGDITATFSMDSVSEEQVRLAALALTGDLEQIPPMVSAIKVDGVRLHELARRGVEIERKARSVHVSRFDIGPGSTPGRFRFEVECSSGTYVRSLVDDLGRALGGGAHLGLLRRTRVGAFSLESAHQLSVFEERYETAQALGAQPELSDLLLSPARALSSLPARHLGDGELSHVQHGRTLGYQGEPAGPVAVLDEAGELVAVYRSDAVGPLAAEVVLVVGDAG